MGNKESHISPVVPLEGGCHLGVVRLVGGGVGLRLGVGGGCHLEAVRCVLGALVLASFFIS